MAVAGRMVQDRIPVFVAGFREFGRGVDFPHRAGHVAIVDFFCEAHHFWRNGQVRAEVRFPPPLHFLVDRFNDVFKTAVAGHDQGRGGIPVGIDALVRVCPRGHERGDRVDPAVHHRVVQGAVLVVGRRVHTHQVGGNGQNGLDAIQVPIGRRLAKLGYGEGAGGRLVRHVFFSSESSLSASLSAIRWPYRSA